MQIGAITLKKLMRRDFEKNIKVPGWAAAQAGLAFPSQPYARAILHSCRNVDRKRALTGHAPATAAHFARIVDHLAAAMTGWASPLQCEETLCMPNFARTTAGRA